MRNDLDAARGIFWWAVVPLVLLVVSAVASAAPTDPIRFCRGVGPSYDGVTADPGCWQSGGDLIVGTVADLLPTDMIAGYDDLLNEYHVWLPSTLIGSPRAFRPYNPVAGTLYEDFASLEWGGDGGSVPEDPPPAGEWTLEDLDLSKAAGAFSAAFMLVAAFWALGKGAGVIVNFLRRI